MVMSEATRARPQGDVEEERGSFTALLYKLFMWSLVLSETRFPDTWSLGARLPSPNWTYLRSGDSLMREVPGQCLVWECLDSATTGEWLWLPGMKEQADLEGLSSGSRIWRDGSGWASIWISLEEWVACTWRMPVRDCQFLAEACSMQLICSATERTRVRFFHVIKAFPRCILKWMPIKSKVCLGLTSDFSWLMRKPRWEHSLTRSLHLVWAFSYDWVCPNQSSRYWNSERPSLWNKSFTTPAILVKYQGAVLIPNGRDVNWKTVPWNSILRYFLDSRRIGT